MLGVSQKISQHSITEDVHVLSQSTDAVAPRQPRYLNPFEGRKKLIQLSGLFLFDPEVLMRLRGQSYRTTFTEIGEESLYKGLERIGRTGQATKVLRDRLISLLPPTLGKSLANALDIPNSPTDAFASMGPWEAYALSSLGNDGKNTVWPTSTLFICNVEHASQPAMELCSREQYAAASEYLACDLLMQKFVWPEMLHAIAKALNPGYMLTLRGVVALEVWLSVLALWDIEARPDDADDDHSFIQQLLTRENSAIKNPVALLFDWLLKTARVTTPSALMKDPRLSKVGIQMGTVGAWSRGTNFPSASYRNNIANALLSTEDAAIFKKLYMAAKQLNFLGYVAQHFERGIGKLKGMNADEAKRLGLTLPFGHLTIESWMRSRYPVWLQFHRTNNIVLVPPSAGPSSAD